MERTSRELHTVMSDAFTLYSEFANGGIEMSWGMNADGSYDKSISNESARHVFVSLYHLAQDLRTFVESPMARNQRRLERLTLNDPAFQRMFTNFQNDINVHSWDQLEQRLGEVAHTVRTELRNCPYFNRLVQILMRMRSLCERTRVISDMGSEAEWAAWW